jgi:hypothetical protein
MKVEQLIKILEKLDKNTRIVLFSDYDRDYIDIGGIIPIDLDREKVSDPYHSHIKYDSRISGKCVYIFPYEE